MEASQMSTQTQGPSIFVEDLQAGINRQRRRLSMSWLAIGIMAFVLIVIPAGLAHSPSWVLWEAPFFIAPVIFLSNSKRALDNAASSTDEYDLKLFSLNSSKRYLKYTRWYLTILIIGVIALVALFIILLLSSGGFHR